MNKIIILLVYITQSINLFAQPGDEPTYINEKAYSQPFLHCVTDEKYFAKYAVEAHSSSFKLIEPIKCKLHIPTGLIKFGKMQKTATCTLKENMITPKTLWLELDLIFM